LARSGPGGDSVSVALCGPMAWPPWVGRSVSSENTEGYGGFSLTGGSDLPFISIDDRWLSMTRGWAFLCVLGLSLLFLAAGLLLPLVEVTAFPGSNMERVVTKSVLGMIHMMIDYGPKHYFGAFIVFAFCLGVPAWIFVGMLVIIFDSFFAMGCNYRECFSPSAHSMIISVMYVTCSYQMLSLFCSLFFVSFFTTKTSSVHLQIGFFAWCAYCMCSILTLQVMDAMRERSDFDEDAVPSLTGSALRRRFSSFVPSLPGFKSLTNVDTLQVVSFMMLYACLFCSCFDQPLLDVRLVYEGIAVERQVLTLRGVFQQLYAETSLALFLPLLLFVVAAPFIYGVLMVAAGLLDTLRRHQCCGSLPAWCFNILMLITEYIRPWVMLDVFAISLGYFLYAANGDYVMLHIPAGIVQFDPDNFSFHYGAPSVEDEGATGEVNKQRLQFFSGIYLLMGSGLAVMFLRWFWSFSEHIPQRAKEGTAQKTLRVFSSYGPVPQGPPKLRTWSELDINIPEEEQKSSSTCRAICGKVCRCLLLWLFVCVVMHWISPTIPQFEVQHMNSILNMTVPLLNKILSEDLPATYGKCVPEGKVPLPCINTDTLHEEMEGRMKVDIMWISGLNTLNITDVMIHRQSQVQLAWGGAGEWWNRNQTEQMASESVVERYVLSVAGEFQKLQLYLHVEDCSQQPCNTLMDSFDACCEGHRHFTVKLAAECVAGDKDLSHVSVEEMLLDSLVIAAQMDKQKAGGIIRTTLPTRDITKDVKSIVQKTLTAYLTHEKFLPWGNDRLDLSMFLNKVIRFNSPDGEFRC